jgi:hypothetical protein
VNQHKDEVKFCFAASLGPAFLGVCLLNIPDAGGGCEAVGSVDLEQRTVRNGPNRLIELLLD